MGYIGFSHTHIPAIAMRYIIGAALLGISGMAFMREMEFSPEISTNPSTSFLLSGISEKEIKNETGHSLLIENGHLRIIDGGIEALVYHKSSFKSFVQWMQYWIDGSNIFNLIDNITFRMTEDNRQVEPIMRVDNTIYIKKEFIDLLRKIELFEGHPSFVCRLLEASLLPLFYHDPIFSNSFDLKLQFIDHLLGMTTEIVTVRNWKTRFQSHVLITMKRIAKKFHLSDYEKWILKIWGQQLDWAFYRNRSLLEILNKMAELFPEYETQVKEFVHQKQNIPYLTSLLNASCIAYIHELRDIYFQQFDLQRTQNAIHNFHMIKPFSLETVFENQSLSSYSEMALVAIPYQDLLLYLRYVTYMILHLDGPLNHLSEKLAFSGAEEKRLQIIKTQIQRIPEMRTSFSEQHECLQQMVMLKDFFLNTAVAHLVLELSLDNIQMLNTAILALGLRNALSCSKLKFYMPEVTTVRIEENSVTDRPEEWRRRILTYMDENLMKSTYHLSTVLFPILFLYPHATIEFALSYSLIIGVIGTATILRMLIKNRPRLKKQIFFEIAA